MLDERTDQVQFGPTEAETAQEFIARRQLANVAVCPGRMASTAEEVQVAAPCLRSLHAHRILIVTSAYHTRRARAIFRHRLPQYQWSVAAAPDQSAYGRDWWRQPGLGQDLVVGDVEIRLVGVGGPVALWGDRHA